MSALKTELVIALATPVGVMAGQPSQALFQLKNDAADLLVDAKSVVEHIERALDLKYSDRAQRLRLDGGKDTGAVHFDDGPVRITADLPKKVDWDQALLADIVRRDERDAGRGAAPMVQAEDAVLLDTTDMDIETAFDAARRIVEAARVRHGL